MIVPNDKALFDLVLSEQSDEALSEIMLIASKNVRDIEVQLGSRNKTDSNGRRLTVPELDQWRQKALRAKNHWMELYLNCKAIRKARNAAKFFATRKQANDGAEAGAGRSQN